MGKFFNKALFMGAVLIGATGFAQLQTSDDALLEVELVTLQSLTVNAGQSTVHLTFDDQADYTNGVSLLQSDHLAILSTVNFIVNVKASGANLTHGTSADVIPVNTITLTSADGTGAATNPTHTPVVLSSTDQELLRADADLIAAYDVTYDASGAGYLNKDSGVYSTTVTYTIIPN